MGKKKYGYRHRYEKLWVKIIIYLSFCYYYGALMFVMGFAIFLSVTLVYPYFPPGGLIYGFLPTIALISALINGVTYGIVFWLISILLVIVFDPS